MFSCSLLFAFSISLRIELGLILTMSAFIHLLKQTALTTLAVWSHDPIPPGSPPVSESSLLNTPTPRPDILQLRIYEALNAGSFNMKLLRAWTHLLCVPFQHLQKTLRVGSVPDLHRSITSSCHQHMFIVLAPCHIEEPIIPVKTVHETKRYSTSI